MKSKPILLIFFLLFGYECYAQDTTKTPKTMSLAGYALEHVTGEIERKFSGSTDGDLKGLIQKIKAEKKKIIENTSGTDNHAFIIAINEDTEALKELLNFTSTAEIKSQLSDVEEDLRVKSSTDTSFALTDVIFEKIKFIVKPCRIAGITCHPIDTCFVRANGWAMRKRPDPLYRFDDQMAHAGLSIELVRGVYGFWIEYRGSPLADPLRKYIKIVVDGSTSNQIKELISQ